MRDLIRVTEQNGQRAVSARELYRFLESETRFDTWIKRMFEYGFEIDKDYSEVTLKNEHNSKGGKSTIIDYALTVDCSKEISMLQRTDKGKQARQYFIELEKRTSQVAKPLSQIEILIQSAQLIQAQEQRLGAVETKMLEIDARTQTRPDFFTIVGYATLHGMSVNLQLASKYGKAASKICDDEGIETGSLPDPRFGKVKTYPTHILKQVFENKIN